MVKTLLILLTLLMVVPIQGQELSLTTKRAKERPQSTGTSARVVPQQSPPLTQPPPQNVSVVSIPPVSVTLPSQSRSDRVLAWGPWVFNLLLVVVGLLQVWWLFRTWQKISDQEARMGEQVSEMKTQATHMAEQLVEMQRQADTMEKQTSVLIDSVELSKKALILQFRPRIVVRGGRVEASVKGEPQTGTVSLTLLNSGSSNAKIFGSEIEAKVIETPFDAVFKTPSSLYANSFELNPGEARTFLVPLDKDIHDSIREADMRHAGTIVGGTIKSVYLVGVIWYVDELGIRRSTGLFRHYEASVNRFIAVDDPDYEYTD